MVEIKQKVGEDYADITYATKISPSAVIILGSYHFRGALVDWNGGEDIWCRSTVRSSIF